MIRGQNVPQHKEKMGVVEVIPCEILERCYSFELLVDESWYEQPGSLEARYMKPSLPVIACGEAIFRHYIT